MEGFIGLYGILTLVVFSKLPYVYIPLYRLCGGDNVLMGLCKFFLLPLLGLHKTVLAAAAVNFIILAAILLVTRGETIGFSGKGLFKIAREKIDRRWVIYLYFICGFAALAYEVTWNRVLTLFIWAAASMLTVSCWQSISSGSPWVPG